MRIFSAEFTCGADNVRSLPPPTLGEVAFGGRSNVGKSTLMNALAQRKSLVRTSRTPGLTRQLNFFALTASAKPGEEPFSLYLVDLPGYGFAKVSKKEHLGWGPLMDAYLGQRPTLRAVTIIVDVRRGVEAEDAQLLDFLTRGTSREAAKPIEVLLVATKLDKISKSERKPALARVTDGAKRAGFTGRPLGVSGETGEGTDILWDRIHKAIL